MLDPRQLAAAQTYAVRVLDLTLTLQRGAGAGAPDGAGGNADNFTTVASNVACSLAKPSAGLMRAYATLLGALSTWLVSVPAGTDVRAQDQILVSGLTLRVQVLFTPESYVLLTTFLASEVR